MEILLDLHMDTDNSNAGRVRVLAGARPGMIRLEVQDPKRSIEIDAEDLMKAIGMLF